MGTSGFGDPAHAHSIPDVLRHLMASSPARVLSQVLGSPGPSYHDGQCPAVSPPSFPLLAGLGCTTQVLGPLPHPARLICGPLPSCLYVPWHFKDYSEYSKWSRQVLTFCLLFRIGLVGCPPLHCCFCLQLHISTESSKKSVKWYLGLFIKMFRYLTDL